MLTCAWLTSIEVVCSETDGWFLAGSEGAHSGLAQGGRGK